MFLTTVNSSRADKQLKQSKLPAVLKTECPVDAWGWYILVLLDFFFLEMMPKEAWIILCPTRGLCTDLKLCIMVVQSKVFQNKVCLSQPCDLCNSSLEIRILHICGWLHNLRIFQKFYSAKCRLRICHIGKLIPPGFRRCKYVAKNR